MVWMSPCRALLKILCCKGSHFICFHCTDIMVPFFSLMFMSSLLGLFSGCFYYREVKSHQMRCTAVITALGRLSQGTVSWKPSWATFQEHRKPGRKRKGRKSTLISYLAALSVPLGWAQKTTPQAPEYGSFAFCLSFFPRDRPSGWEEPFPGGTVMEPQVWLSRGGPKGCSLRHPAQTFHLVLWLPKRLCLHC